MAKKTVKEVIEESMPDMEVVEKVPAPVPDTVRRNTAPGPSMDQLRKKYLGSAAEEYGAADREVAGPTDEGDVEVRQVRPKRRPSDPAADPGPRTVIVSKKKGILGIQG